MRVTLAGKAVPGPSVSAWWNSDLEEGEDTTHQFASMGISPRSFPLEQMCDESLRHAFDQVKATHVQKIQKAQSLFLLFSNQR